MPKKGIILLCSILAFSCGELQQIANQIPTENTGIVSKVEIAKGLQEALQLGIKKQVSKLTQKDGFYSNELVKIRIPQELQKVDKTLRNIGLGQLADEGLKVLNRAAEDAVSEATPIFIDAVNGISFTDAKSILLGSEDAATQYLSQATENSLRNKFTPIISASFKKVGAEKIWKNLITKYNSIPLTTDVDPDITSYVTEKSLSGVYTMIAIEEKEIRTNISSRSTDLLKKVFIIQD